MNPGRCAERSRYGKRDREAEAQRLVEQLAPALRRGLRDQHRQARADAGHGNAGDEVDDRRKLCPQRHQLAAAAQGEDLVERRARGEPYGDYRKREKELDRLPVVTLRGEL